MAKVTRHGGASDKTVAPIVTYPKGKGSERAEPTPVPEPEHGGDDVYDGYTADELRAGLRVRHLPTSGTKPELIDRLLDDDTAPE